MPRKYYHCKDCGRLCWSRYTYPYCEDCRVKHLWVIPSGTQVRLVRDVGELKAGDIVTVKETNEMNDVWLIKQVSPRELTDYGWTRRENVEPLRKEEISPEMTKDPYK